MEQRTFEQLRDAAADCGAPAVLIDAEFRVQWVNEPFQQLVGYDLEDLEGRDVRELQSSVSASGAERVLRRDVEYQDSFGDPVWVQSTMVPLFTDGTCVGYLLLEVPAGATSEHAELQALRHSLLSTESLLRESQGLYRELYQNSTDLIQSTNTRGEVMFVNQMWLTTIGCSEPEAIGRSMADVLGDDSQHLMPIFRCEVSQPNEHLRLALRGRGGELVWVEGTISYRFVDGRAVGTHAILRDITQRERLERMKQEFVSMVNHELRTPLTSIVGALHLLQDGAAGELSPKANEFIDIGLRNANRLGGLVEKVLDYDKLAAGKLRPQFADVEVMEFLDALIGDHATMGGRRAVAIHAAVGEQTMVESDPRMLRHIVGNFMANAIRFAPEGGNVWLGATRNPGGLRVWVCDDGPGVPQPFRHRVFEPFEQAEDAGTGTGLGLSIARRMAELVGASVGFVSVTGVGTTFYVDIPRRGDGAAGPPLKAGDHTDIELIRLIGSTADATVDFTGDARGPEWRDELASCPANLDVQNVQK